MAGTVHDFDFKILDKEIAGQEFLVSGHPFRLLWYQNTEFVAIRVWPPSIEASNILFSLSLVGSDEELFEVWSERDNFGPGYFWKRSLDPKFINGGMLRIRCCVTEKPEEDEDDEDEEVPGRSWMSELRNEIESRQLCDFILVTSFTFVSF